MFESLTERLQGVFRNLRRRGMLRPEDVEGVLREVRLALLEADVHYQVVKDIIERVRQRALSEEVSRALNPAQQVIKVIHQELVAALGEPGRLNLVGQKPWALMLVGLQGSGKTTTAAKLAAWLRARGERTWLVAADPYRPAAVDQLMILGRKIDVPVFYAQGLSPPELSQRGFEAAGKAGVSAVVFDTAGRSQLDQPMMDELREIRKRVSPVEILLVADAMTGQEAVNIAKGFAEPLGLTGLILTKMDGDARGGASISMRAVTDVPVKFIGTGEGLEAFEVFEPDRLAKRILGMGDVVGLIEKAEASFDREQVERQAARMMQGEFTLEDLYDQLDQVRRMGPLGKILEMLPLGMVGGMGEIDSRQAARQLKRSQAIIQSMTRLEKRRPAILNASRKRRIAAGSGTTVQEVNQLLRQHRQMQRVLGKLRRGGLGDVLPWLR